MRSESPYPRRDWRHERDSSRLSCSPTPRSRFSRRTDWEFLWKVYMYRRILMERAYNLQHRKWF